MVEGRRVARLLTWNPEYRLHRRKMLETVVAAEEEDVRMKEKAGAKDDGVVADDQGHGELKEGSRNSRGKKGGWVDMGDLRPVREGSAKT
jgi:hypothetical protein